MLGVTFGSKHSYNDWGIWLEDTHINPPLPKRYIVDVPARNGLLDLTPELTPTIRFENRTLTFTFRVKAGDWSSLLSTIYGQVHGQTLDVVSDLDPNWHWHGCVTVDDFSSDERTGVLVITVDADPFKLSNTENSYTVNGNGTITCVVDRMEISPAFEVEAPTTVVYGDSSYVISSYRTIEKTAFGDIATFNDGTANPVVSLTANIDAVQSGSGTPSPSNVREISGFSEVNVNVAGKNLLPNTKGNQAQSGLTYTWNADGGMTISGTTSTGVTIASYVFNDNVNILNIGVGTYRLYLTGSGTGYSDINLQAYVDGVSQIYTKNGTFTVSSEATKSYIRLRIPSGTYNVTVYPMLLLSTETNYSFEPYIGNTYTASLGSTVYGGTLNITTGVLTVTTAYINMPTASGTATTNNVRRFYTTPLATYSGIVACDSYKIDTLATSLGVIAWSNDNRIAVAPPWAQSITTASDFNTALANNQFHIVMELATPQTYMLMPQQVRTLLGINNVWADSGSVNVTYRAQDFEGMKFYIPELEMTEGSHSLTIQGTGTTKVTYTNGRL